MTKVSRASVSAARCALPYKAHSTALIRSFRKAILVLADRSKPRLGFEIQLKLRYISEAPFRFGFEQVAVREVDAVRGAEIDEERLQKELIDIDWEKW